MRGGERGPWGTEKAQRRLEQDCGAGKGPGGGWKVRPGGRQCLWAFKARQESRPRDMGVAAQPPEQMAWPQQMARPGQSLDMRACEPDQSCGIGNGKFKREGHITNTEQQVWQV